MLDLSLSTRKSAYFNKDQAKAQRANKFIGRGSLRSSTNAYANALPPHLVNSGNYTANDRVFISAEGARGGRIAPDFTEIKRALDAGATIITDTAYDRERPYNIGEQEVAMFLMQSGYIETANGQWQPRRAASTNSSTRTSRLLSF